VLIFTWQITRLATDIDLLRMFGIPPRYVHPSRPSALGNVNMDMAYNYNTPVAINCSRVLMDSNDLMSSLFSRRVADYKIGCLTRSSIRNHDTSFESDPSRITLRLIFHGTRNLE